MDRKPLQSFPWDLSAAIKALSNIAARDVNGRGTALNALTTSRGYRRIDVIGGGHVTVHIF
jgi:hypothetical protein